MNKQNNLSVSIFADGADLATILELNGNSLISGITTNPSLIKKAGVKNYREFARSILEIIREKPVSFEVLGDNLEDMEREARILDSWGDNVYVKIPITNTRGESTANLIQKLSNSGVKVNVTAIMTVNQVKQVASALSLTVPSFVSIFAGRIADTGVDPVPIMKESLDYLRSLASDIELIWASPREVLNVVQASEIGCHVITLTNDLITKLSLLGRDLNQYSLETVRMFYSDGKESGLSIN